MKYRTSSEKTGQKKKKIGTERSIFSNRDLVHESNTSIIGEPEIEDMW